VTGFLLTLWLKKSETGSSEGCWLSTAMEEDNKDGEGRRRWRSSSW